ncbi:MAG: hypothetical protein ACYDGN_07925 [Acidimicrobiales bacterium]
MARTSNSPRGPVTTLRGAGVDVDAARAARVLVGACLVGLAVAVVILSVSGFQKNAEITLLRQQGVSVPATVTGCLGQMGGSGSNLAGYSCRGTLVFHGRRYQKVLPGSALHRPGSLVWVVVAPGDPGLLATRATLSRQHASSRVFLLPVCLLVVLVGLAGVVLTKWHRRLGRPAYFLREGAGGV